MIFNLHYVYFYSISVIIHNDIYIPHQTHDWKSTYIKKMSQDIVVAVCICFLNFILKNAFHII